MRHILVVDDDQHIRDVICFTLEKAGYKVSVARDGGEALVHFRANQLDLIVLDVGLPEMDGLEVCRQIRKDSEVPILFLSARSDEIDRVLGLEIGGDDYVTKPFSPRELSARVSVILKRMNPSPVVDDETSVLTMGDLTLDPAHRSVRFNLEAVSLTASEFNILQIFLRRPRVAFTREQIMVSAYPANIHVSDRTIDSHIRNVRWKLNSVGCANAIETVHGVGFRLGSCQSVAQ
ncbi:MAG: response regulator transcription factor [Stappiaceae bacterium]